MLTLSKIAKLASVSVSTASKAFSMSPEVSEETRQMIFDIAKKHGCFKKFFNAKYPKLVIAVICPEFESLHYASLLAKLQTALEKRGCEICVATTQFSKERCKELVDYYTRYARVDGILLCDCASGLYAAGDVPIVCVGNASDKAVRVVMQKRTAMEEAVDHFLSHGIENIGFLGERLTVSKERTFTEIIEERGIKPSENMILCGERFADGGYQTMKDAIARGSVPRALICAYDYLAIGAVRALTESGYRIPEDVAIIGMDDIPEAKFLNPPLSSINSNFDEVCEAASETLINILMGRPYEKSTVVRHTLNLRGSSEV